MSEQAEKKTSSAFGYVLASIVAMGASSLAIHLIDRFHRNETAWHFYTPSVDMTCVVAKSRGQEVMSCVPGDHRVGVGVSHD